jgi:hypothetical protein
MHAPVLNEAVRHNVTSVDQMGINVYQLVAGPASILKLVYKSVRMSTEERLKDCHVNLLDYLIFQVFNDA